MGAGPRLRALAGAALGIGLAAARMRGAMDARWDGRLPGEDPLPLPAGDPAALPPPALARLDRAEGLLAGLVAGEAFGAPAEFLAPSEIRRRFGEDLAGLTAFPGGGEIGWEAGEATDEGDMALAIAASLARRRGWDPEDASRRLLAWYRSGPKDVGTLTAAALERAQRGESWREAGEGARRGAPEGGNAGNGGLIRSLPIALALEGEEADRAAGECSAITHADPRCTEASRVLVRIAGSLVRGVPAPAAVADARDWAAAEAPHCAPVLLDAERDPPARCPSSGYVVDTLRIAVSALLHSGSFEEGVVEVVRRGGDADSNAAAAGALLGARDGARALPAGWLSKVRRAGEMRDLARRLWSARGAAE